MIYAKLTSIENGYPEERFKLYILDKRHYYEVSEIDMGDSSTKIYLRDFKDEVFNSVNFSFYETKLKKINIYKDPRFYKTEQTSHELQNTNER